MPDRRAVRIVRDLASTLLFVVVTACGGGGSSPSTGPTIHSFTASPENAAGGAVVTLSWNVSGATSLSIAPHPGTVTGTSVVVAPTATTTYSLTATGADGTATARTTVTVAPANVAPFAQRLLNTDLAASASTRVVSSRTGLAVPSTGVVPFPPLTYHPRRTDITPDLCRRLDHAPDGAYQVTVQPLTDYESPKLVAGQTYHLFTRLAQTGLVDGLTCASPSYGIQSCFKVGACPFGGVGIADEWVFSLDCTGNAAVIESQSPDGDVFLRAVTPGGSCTLWATGKALADSGVGTKDVSATRTFEVVPDDDGAPRIEQIEFDGKPLVVREAVPIDPSNMAHRFLSGQFPPGFASPAPWFCGDPSRASLPCTTYRVTGANVSDAAWKLTTGNMGGAGTEFFWQMPISRSVSYGLLVTGQSGQGAITQSKIFLYSGGDTPIPGTPIIASLTASPSSVDAGGPATLSWSVTGATSISIEPGIGVVTGTSATVRPSANTTYTLTATNDTGASTARVTVTLKAPVITSFTVTPSSMAPGETALLSWAVTGATSLSLNQAIGPVTGSSYGITTKSSKRYVLTATNEGGSTTATTELKVGDGETQMTELTYSENPAVYRVGVPITPNVPSTLAGMPTSYSAAILPAGLNLDPKTGIVSGTPTATWSGGSSIRATNAAGSISRTVTIRVDP